MASFTLTLQRFNGSQVELAGLCGSTSLGTLMDMIQDRCELPLTEQRLILGASVVECSDRAATLASLGIGDGADLALVRVGLPQTGRYVGQSCYEDDEGNIAFRYDVCLDCAAWHWLDAARGALEFELTYRVLFHHELEEYTNCEGSEIFEGVYDWDTATLTAKGLFLKPVGALRSQRPYWLSLPRQGVIDACFRICSSSGYVSSSNLKRVAKILGWEGDDEAWTQEYQAQCMHLLALQECGLDAVQFEAFLEQNELTDLELMELLAGLEGGVVEQGGIELHRFLSLTPKLEMRFCGQEVFCTDDGTTYSLRRL
eukprot:TRINITY_DN49690_c0_g1_i1.p1 TRINITY_DN49690_c0_g1~~TRINITY_DN49690_c0_g1_i1.p1  ORF type:complete len:327 (-),score=60.19 TRINITY_DN49690_c0_g1_i1:59-1000(-)